MKRSKDIIGLPVIDISRGTELGKTKRIFIDATQKKVVALELSNKKPTGTQWNILELPNVKNIGKDAVTVDSETALKEASDTKKSSPEIIGMKVLSEDGSIVGNINDYSFSLPTGSIEELYIQADRIFKKYSTILAQEIINIGEDYVITSQIKVRDEEKDTSSTYEQIKDSSKSFTHSLEIKAIKFALGKQVKSDVYLEKGLLLISKGETVTSETIDKARQAGKLHTLLIATGVGEILEGLDYTWEKLDAGSKRLMESWQKFKEERMYKGHTDSYSYDSTQKKDYPDNGIEIEIETEDQEYEYEDEEDNKSWEKSKEEGQEIWAEWHKNIENTAQDMTKYSREKAKSFMLGRVAGFTVKSKGEETIIKRGEIITESVIDNAKMKDVLSKLFLSAMDSEMEKTVTTIKEKMQDIFSHKD